MWLSAIKLAVSAGSKIYANKQKNEDGYVRCTAYARISYGRRKRSLPGKTFRSPSVRLEGRGSFDNFKFARAMVLAWAVVSDDPTAMDKVKLFFDMFSQLPSWFTNLWILVVASIYGIKGTQIFKNGGKK
jgi:hypothetical protein